LVFAAITLVKAAVIPNVYCFDCNDIGLTLDAHHPNVSVTMWGEKQDIEFDVALSYFPTEPDDHNYITWEPWIGDHYIDDYQITSIQSTDGYSVVYHEGPVTCGKWYTTFLPMTAK
jgi:hypothetical protein